MLRRMAHQFDKMWEGAVPALLVYPEERCAAVDIELRGLREEVLLVGLHEVLHYHVCNLRAVREARYVLGIQRIAAQRVPGVLEIDHTEHRTLQVHPVIAADVLQKHVVYVKRERRVLVVIHEHGISLAYHLLHERQIYREGLSRAWSSEDHRAAEGIDDIDPSRMLLALVLVARLEVDGEFRVDLLFALQERLLEVVALLDEPGQLVQGEGCAENDRQVPDCRGRRIDGRIAERKEIQEDSRNGDNRDSPPRKAVSPAVTRHHGKQAEHQRQSLRVQRRGKVSCPTHLQEHLHGYGMRHAH